MMKKSIHKMKKGIAFLMVLALSIVWAGNAFAADTSVSYVDVYPEDWYYDAVIYVKDARLMFGKDATHFVPYGEDGYLQRQDIAVILGRHYTNVIDNQLSLSTTNGTYYADSVAWVKECGIMNGYSDGNFGVGDNITREDLLVVLERYINKIVDYYSAAVVMLRPAGLEQYADNEKVSDYAWEAVRDSVFSCIIQGYENEGVKTLEPQGYVTRGMAAVILKRFFEYHNKDIAEAGHPIWK